MPGQLTVVDHPLVQHKLSLLRDRQTASAQFRRLLKEIGILLAYEATRDLALTTVEVQTPLESMTAPVLAGKKVALVSVLRAGNGLLDGALEILPSARIGHVGMYRDEDTLQAVEYYCNLPRNMNERDVFILDPMLATGHSSATAVDRVRRESPRSMRFIALVAAPEGVEYFHDRHPDVPIFTAAVDRQLDERGYILPGLGDAGDRLFGTKQGP
jgi:uracil phosphoribosyltransferase